jgi:ribosome-binding protein aMBF1 (putative translation factor)
MRKSKKARLEARGWRFGSAKELLGLSDQQSAYVELRFRLAESLRVRRQKRKLSQADLAKMLRSSQLRIPEHREHRFRPIVNTDSGILNSDSGDRER